MDLIEPLLLLEEPEGGFENPVLGVVLISRSAVDNADFPLVAEPILETALEPEVETAPEDLDF